MVNVGDVGVNFGFRFDFKEARLDILSPTEPFYGVETLHLSALRVISL